MEVEQLDMLVGVRFPGGAFAIEPYEDWLLRDALGADSGDGIHAHPLWGFAAPQRSMGITIDEVFELCGARASDGPLLGDTSITTECELLLEQRYTVAAGITSAQRKHGRSMGTFDVVHFTATTFDPDGVLVGRLTNSFVFPRSLERAT